MFLTPKLASTPSLTETIVKSKVTPTDLDLILRYYDRSLHNIPLGFNQITWDPAKTYRARVCYIYDPSKFWIVHKYKELDLFQVYLNKFYKVNKESYAIPEEQLKRNIYCVVLVDGGFYRGVIVNIPHPTSLVLTAYVFLIDFAYVSEVPVNSIFYLNGKCYGVPQFAVRARLDALFPFDTNSWTENVVDKFYKLVNNRIVLFKVAAVVNSNCLLEVNIANFNETRGDITDVSEVLIRERLASRILYKNTTQNVLTKMYLLPSFEALENSYTPSNVKTLKYLKQCHHKWDKLQENYQTNRNYSKLEG